MFDVLETTKGKEVSMHLTSGKLFNLGGLVKLIVYWYPCLTFCSPFIHLFMQVCSYPMNMMRELHNRILG